MRAGIQLSRSSKRAATRPKYKYFWFLYPSIESIVLAVLYRIAPIGPPRIKKNNGAIIPSTVFSAMVSTVARVISLSSNSSVSRPTIQDNRLRASTILSCLINWLIVKPAPASERGDIAIYKIITSRAYSTHSSTTPPSHSIKDTIMYTETRIKPTAIPPYHNFLVSLSVSL